MKLVASRVGRRSKKNEKLGNSIALESKRIFSKIWIFQNFLKFEENGPENIGKYQNL